MLAKSAHSSYFDSQDSSLVSSQEQDFLKSSQEHQDDLEASHLQQDDTEASHSLQDALKANHEQKDQLEASDEKPEDLQAEKLKRLKGLLESAEMIRLQGNEQFTQKSFQNAMILYLKSIESVPPGEFQGYFAEEIATLKLKCLTNIVRCYLALDLYKSAIETCLVGFKEFPANVPLLYLCATALEKTEEYGEAVKILQIALELEPSNPQVISSLSRVKKAIKDQNTKYKAMFSGKLLTKPKEDLEAPKESQTIKETQKETSPLEKAAKEPEASGTSWSWLVGVSAIAALGALGVYLLRRPT